MAQDTKPLEPNEDGDDTVTLLQRKIKDEEIVILINKISNFEIRTSTLFDPFADASKGDDLFPAVTEDYIHIRIQQRNSSKTVIAVQGIADDYNKRKLVKAFKKKFACNSTITEHPEYGEAIQVQGDPEYKNISQFLGGNRPAADHTS
ncbi:Eukaryotic Translation Initiation Factor 1 [Manis pentadactyla]|nr:Eukaryotic Translation Initiation Factor 1 [Manis pentadactyla]